MIRAAGLRLRSVFFVVYNLTVLNQVLQDFVLVAPNLPTGTQVSHLRLAYSYRNMISLRPQVRHLRTM